MSQIVVTLLVNGVVEKQTFDPETWAPDVCKGGSLFMTEWDPDAGMRLRVRCFAPGTWLGYETTYDPPPEVKTTPCACGAMQLREGVDVGMTGPRDSHRRDACRP